MLKLKNAQYLSRADMKKLSGGTNHNSSRLNCDDQCDYDPDAGTRVCNDGKHCIVYSCPGQPEITSYKCV
ncbi:hypothetical protein SAMN05421820_106238 [Pedobacter steynii]|uniref:Uncharacterized protein n=1 Tax=Pedobacter steynii TaxID=430522 RepID=A0A1G9YUU5_9SPHI|nr:hypothetical protein [Pedobacter steynii]NQX39838.1 hypothetical protein [Pedobacter steynii]SDN12727.1 hypothetical protein SAMN05421820_106238 [Pedobacter steynii]